MRRQSSVIAVSVMLGLLASLVAAQAQVINRDLDSYVILAIDEFQFKGGNEGTNTRGRVLGGNVGVNNPDPNIGDTQANMNVGANGLFVMSDDTQLVSGSIRLGVEASVWDVYVDPSGEKGSGWGATNPKIGGLTIRNSKFSISNSTDLPIIDPANLTTNALCGPFDPVGTLDVSVPKNGTLTLLPGQYQDVNVQNGGTLHLLAGTYTVRRFTTGQNVNVYTVPGTVIHIWGDNDPNSRDFNLGGNGSYLGSEDPNVESVACICVSDVYANSTVQFSDNGIFWGVIKAPNASINLGRNFTHYGRFIGRTIGSDFNDNVTYRDCTFQPQGGTTLSASKTASGHLGVSYQWTIDKTVTPDTWNLFRGDSGTSQYTVTVTKSAGTGPTAHVEGQICVTNTGSVATEGLQIVDTVTDPLNNVMGSITVDVSAKPTLLPGEGYCYPYRVDFANPGAADDTTTYTNTATITIANFQSGGPVVAMAATELELAPENDSIVVNDTNGGSWTFTDSESVTYDKTYTASADCGTHTNQATIQDTGQSAQTTVQVNCYELDVSKDATASFSKRYEWTIDKSALLNGSPVPDPIVLAIGQQAVPNYGIKLDATLSESDWSVSGNIYVHNPAPIPATINGISDVVSPAIAASVTCGVAFPYVLTPGQTLTCSYTASLPDGSARVNTATATLQNFSYDYQMNASPAGTTDFSGTAGVAFGATGTLDECVTVEDTFKACPWPIGRICIGDMEQTDGTYTKSWYYSRVIGPYFVCGEYKADNTVSFTTEDTMTTGSDSVQINVSVPCAGGCTLTPGYWKTHSKYGPAPYDDTWALLGEDTVFFLSGQTYYEVLWTPPAGGNAYYILAHAYIAAKLNILNGASSTPEVDMALSWAENFFTSYAPDDKLSKSLRKEAVKLAGLLDDYNNGYIGPGHCSE